MPSRRERRAGRPRRLGISRPGEAPVNAVEVLDGSRPRPGRLVAEQDRRNPGAVSISPSGESVQRVVHREDAEVEREVELHVPVLDEQRTVAGVAVDDAFARARTVTADVDARLGERGAYRCRELDRVRAVAVDADALDAPSSANTTARRAVSAGSRGSSRAPGSASRRRRSRDRRSPPARSERRPPRRPGPAQRHQQRDAEHGDRLAQRACSSSSSATIEYSAPCGFTCLAPCRFGKRAHRTRLVEDEVGLLRRDGHSLRRPPTRSGSPTCAPIPTRCSTASATVRRNTCGSPPWKPTATFAEVRCGINAASSPASSARTIRPGRR